MARVGRKPHRMVAALAVFGWNAAVAVLLMLLALNEIGPAYAEARGPQL